VSNETKRVGVVVVLLALASGPVSAATVKTDHDATVDFSQYKTYGWKAKAPPPEADPDGTFRKLDELVKTTADAELDARGYVHDEGEPDVWMSYVVNANAEAYLDVHRWEYASTATVETYAQGDLVFEFLDAKTGKVVWRGAAVGGVKPEKRDTRIPKIVRQILQKFPPPAAKP
jgi:hypothetical protein